MPPLQGFSNIIDVEWPLRNQDDVGTPGDAAVNSDPAGVTAHDLNDDHAIVGLGCGMHAINRLSGDGDRGIEAEAEVGAAQVIVNGLGNCDYRDFMIMEFQSDGLRVIAANRDQGVDRVLLDSADAGLDSAILLSGIGSRGTQNSAA